MDLKTEKDIRRLIENEIPESTTLEYKDPRSLSDNKEIAKDISAMANSEGGIIIYGLCEKEKNHIPKKINWLTKPKEKERIEQIIQTRINPKIEGYKIKSIHSDKNKNEFVIIVEVPKSDIAPHQANRGNTKKYYRRNNFNIREMEHYEIEDLFFKRKRPKLKISLKVRGIPGKEIFDINVLNVGKIIAEKITIVLKVPPKLKIKCGSKWLRTTREDYLEEEYQFFENEVPFYPNLVASIGEIYHQEKKRIKKFKVLFLIVCNRMEVIKGEIEVNLENHNINYRELIYKNSSEEGIPFIEFW